MTIGAQYTYTDSQTGAIAFPVSSITFAGLNLGPDAADRVIVFGYGHSGNNFGVTVNSVTLNGTPMVQGAYILHGAAGDAIGIWTLFVPTGATATIVVTHNVATNIIGVGMVGYLTGAVNQVNQTQGYPSNFNADPQTFASASTIYAFGVGVVFMMDPPSTQPQPVAWAAPTVVDFTNTFDVTAQRCFSVAHSNVPGAWQPSVRGLGGGNGLGSAGCCMVLGTWQQTGLETFVPMGQACL